jgi:hypothetical protein
VTPLFCSTLDNTADAAESKPSAKPGVCMPATDGDADADAASDDDRATASQAVGVPAGATLCFPGSRRETPDGLSGLAADSADSSV